MKTLRVVFLIVMGVASNTRADGIVRTPAERYKLVEEDRLKYALTQIVALSKMVITENDDKDKLLEKKAKLENSIERIIEALDDGHRKAFDQALTAKVADLNAQLKDAKEGEQRDALLEQLNACKTLRAKYFHSSIDSKDGMGDGRSHRTLFAGIALTMAFASAGLMFMRKGVR